MWSDLHAAPSNSIIDTTSLNPILPLCPPPTPDGDDEDEEMEMEEGKGRGRGESWRMGNLDLRELERILEIWTSLSRLFLRNSSSPNANTFMQFSVTPCTPTFSAVPLVSPLSTTLRITRCDSNERKKRDDQEEREERRMMIKREGKERG